MKLKSEVFDHFVHFKVVVKYQFNATIKQFQCDSGGEFLNKKLEYLFTTFGIIA